MFIYSPNFACEWGSYLFSSASCPPACQATPPDSIWPSAGHPAATRRPVSRPQPGKKLPPPA